MPEYPGRRVKAFTKDVVYKLLAITRRLVAYRKHTITGLLRSTFLSPSLVLITCSISVCVVAKDYNLVADNIKYFFLRVRIRRYSIHSSTKRKCII